MPNTQDREDNRFSRYDAMSTEELQAFLREDASKPEGEGSDTKEILYVMEVLARRRKENQEGKNPAEALASFKLNYYTENEIPSISESVPVARKRSSSGRWKRGLVAAVAAICILVIGNSITASALDFDLFAIIAKWTQETFHFGSAGQPSTPDEPSPNYANPCASLEDALKENKVTLAIVPTWIPDEYTEGDVRITNTPKQRVFQGKYLSGEKCIIIRIANYLDSVPLQVEQSESLIEIYSSNGINYYIFDNHDMLKTVWIIENFECYISGPISVSEMKEIIDSIKKG